MTQKKVKITISYKSTCSHSPIHFTSELMNEFSWLVYVYLQSESINKLSTQVIMALDYGIFSRDLLQICPNINLHCRNGVKQVIS